MRKDLPLIFPATVALNWLQSSNYQTLNLVYFMHPKRIYVI